MTGLVSPASAGALEASGWNVAEVCRTPGIPRPTLYRKLHEWSLGARRS